MDKIPANNKFIPNIESTQSKGTQCIPCRYVYSAPSRFIEDRLPDCGSCNSEGDVNNDLIMANVGQTDSEITVLRVRMESAHLKSRENNWTMKEDAIPGDGSHLGSSPSLVNLATFMVHNKSLKSDNFCEGDEYLVPLSSWDPDDKPHDLQLESTEESINSRSNNTECPLTETELKSSQNKHNKQTQRPSFAGKFRNFLKKHCTKKSKV